VAISNAQQVNFDQQLNHSEDLIRELDRELIEVDRQTTTEEKLQTTEKREKIITIKHEGKKS
jgi:hypothetical protein